MLGIKKFYIEFNMKTKRYRRTLRSIAFGTGTDSGNYQCNTGVHLVGLMTLMYIDVIV